MQRYIAIPDGAEGRLELETVSVPEPEPDELLIRVFAAGVNHGDIIFRQGSPDPRLPKTGPLPVGLEAAGLVEAVGSAVTDWHPGQRVMARCWGAYGEYVAVKAALAMEIPPALSWTEAACIPITFVVAHDALITNGQMITGTDVLVNAASSGIGVAAIQIGRFLGAGEVIGSSRSADKQDALRKLGASAVVDAASPTFVEEVRAATHGDGVQVVVDSIGGPTLPVNMEAMRLEGRLVSVGRMGGTSSACDLDLLALKRLRLIGVTNRTRTLGQQAECVRRFLNDAGGGLSSRALTPHIDREFPWTQALAAQDYLASGRHVGKVVLRVKE